MAERQRGGELLRALRGALTPRGSTFFVAALAALLVGEILGERDLVSIAALLAALPLAAVVVVARSRYRIRLRRTLTPQRVEAGHEARILLRMENVARLPTTTLLMEDTLPYALGGRPRFVLRGLESTGVREVTYGVRTEHRGHFEIGPLTVRVSDPFGSLRLYRIAVIRDMLREAGDRPLASTSGWAANAELLVAASRFARRVETVELDTRIDLRQRETRVRPFNDALELFRATRALRALRAQRPAAS